MRRLRNPRLVRARGSNRSAFLPQRPVRSARIAASLAVIATALILAGCQSPASRTEALDRLFADLHERRLFDGAVAVSDKRGTFAKGYGYANVARSVPFAADTPTDGASLAKTFTAALLIAMEADGLVHLDDPAQFLLPELPYPTVTLRHLLSHTSGIPVRDYGFFDAYLMRDQIRTTETLLRVIAEQRPALVAQPGEAFDYSSFGYDLAALAAARAGGKPLAQLLAQKFFQPLGLSSAFLRPGRLDEFPGVRTLGYRHDGARTTLNDALDLEQFHGGSNIYISARDLAKWNASFIEGRVLPPRALERALQAARVGSAPSGLTLGSWYRSADGSAFWYSGHLQGFHNEVFRDIRSGASIVYVSNNTVEPWLQKAIVRAVADVLAGGPGERLVPPATDDVSKNERVSLVGTWVMAKGERIVIQSSGETLQVERFGVRYRIVQVAARAFYVPGLDLVLGFARRQDGSFDRIHVSTNVDEQWGERLRDRLTQ
jgi:CubicO group peptidase (beta-lactamase class C family)